MLSLQRLRQVLRYLPDSGLFIWTDSPNPRFNGCVAGTKTHGRCVIRLDGRGYFRSHLVYLWATGSLPPKDMDLDHRNRNKMDDRITNLRLCTRSANCLNKEVQTNNKLGLRNIHKNYVGEYVVQIQANGARLRKSFTDLLSAVQYRDAVVLSLHGDYAGAYSRVASPPAEVHAPPCVARASADSDSGVDSPV